jgi:hypothetical protein
VFINYADQDTKRIKFGPFKRSLIELGVRLPSDEIKAVFETADTDESGGLYLAGFTRAIQYPCQVEQWAATLPLSQLLAQCLSFKESSDDPLRKVSRLSADELRASADAFSENLRKILAEALSKLSLCFAEVERSSAVSAGHGSKFETFKMSSGSVADFHKGLLGRVGGCSMLHVLSII